MRIRIRGILACAIMAGSAQVRVSDAKAAAPADDGSQWATSAPVKQAIESARSYWSAEEPGYEEDVRVLSTTTGAFTASGVEQRAVLYRMGTVPRGFPKKGLAILEGDRLVRNIAFLQLSDSVEALSDFDGDGRDELVLEGGFGMGDPDAPGPTSSRISLAPDSGLQIQHFSKATCESETWEPVGEPEPLVLEPPDKKPFVDISAK
jgi:hypothetical protein